jgi:hypothetical protein
MMTLRELLDITDHEVWVRAYLPDRKRHVDVWSADWIGGDGETYDRLMPYLEMDVDDMRPESHLDPNAKERKDVTMICVNLYEIG